MTTQQEITSFIERQAPLRLQEEYDNSGLQAGDLRQEVTHILVSLDVTEETVAEAQAIGAEMIVSHHPLLFRPLKKISPGDYIGRTVMAAIRAGITLYAAHTNLDNAPKGVNFKIAEKLKLEKVRPLAPLPSDRTASLPDDFIVGSGSGVIGNLPQPMSGEDLVTLVKEIFHCSCIKHTDARNEIRRVALCGGAGSFLINTAIRQNADAFLTGEVGYHAFFGHPELMILEAGHYETEQYTCQLLAEMIGSAFPDVKCSITGRQPHPVITD